jgi:hypothetical protein
MFPFLLPLVAVGLCVFAARSHKRREAPVAAIVSGDTPSPLAVLCGFLRVGAEPPPPVILCALAEAEATEQHELADQIVRTFMAPVVAGAVAAAKNANASAAKAPPAYGGRHHVPLYSKEQQHEQEAKKAKSANAGSSPRSVTEAEGRDKTNDADGKIPVQSDDDVARAMAAMAAQHAGMSESRAAHVAHPLPSLAAATATHAAHVRGSPIIGIDPQAWDAFVGRVAREAPTFASPRHVGRFRQRRERLAELDIDPDSVLADPDAQLDALDADMSDAYEHARAGGLADHVGRVVEIDGAEHEITLSGVMGVIQAAGLEGACEWLEKERDRRRFPHTTAAFTRTNGVF